MAIAHGDHVLNFTHQSNHLHVPLLKLAFELRERPQLRGANRSEIGGMGEENGPFSFQPLVEVDFTLSRLGSEVGRFGTQSQPRLLRGRGEESASE